MTINSVARASALVGLALIVAGCGTSSPVTPSAATTSAPSVTSAPSSAVPSDPSATETPTIAPTPAPVVVAAASLEPALEQLWQVGGPKAAKGGACCVTVAPDGKVWVAAGFDSTFWILDANGKYLESWGEAGSGDGQFRFPVKSDFYGAIAFDPDGTFYVADTGNARIQKFDKNRKFLMAWGEFGSDDGELTTPMDIASDGHGQIYVVDNNRGDVQVFSSDGTYIRTLVTELKNYFIDLDPEGRLYVDNGPEILIFDSDGTQLPGLDVSATGGFGAGVAFDTAGNTFVSIITAYGPSAAINPIAIYELNDSGAVLHAWPGQEDSLALDPKGGALYSSYYKDQFIRKLELPKP